MGLATTLTPACEEMFNPDRARSTDDGSSKVARRSTRWRGLATMFGGAVLSLSFGPAYAQVGINLRLMPLGDSITAGYLSSTGDGYRGPLFTTLSGQVGTLNFVGSQFDGTMADPNNEGHFGDEINAIAGLATGELNTYRPNIITLHIGSNDLNNNYDVSTAPTRLAALIDQIVAAEPDATVLVAQLIPNANATVEARIVTYNAAIPAIVQARASKGEHVFVVSMSSLTTADLHDGLHPNDTGYQKMANAWDAAIKQVISAGWITYPVAGSLAHPLGTITSGVAGECLNDPGNSSSDSTVVEVASCSNAASQQWDVNSGSIRINGKCLDIDGGGSANGTPVDIYSCNGGTNQVWTNKNGTLYNAVANKCLDDPNSSNVTGTHLQIWECNGGANQKWQLPSVGPIQSGIAGKCLDNYAASDADRNPTDLYTCNQSAAQQWQVSNNLVRIGGKCLDIAGAGTADGTPVELYQCTGNENQVWMPVGGMLVNPATGKCLDDPKSSTANTTQIDIAACTGAANQKWAPPSY